VVEAEHALAPLFDLESELVAMSWPTPQRAQDQGFVAASREIARINLNATHGFHISSVYISTIDIISGIDRSVNGETAERWTA
jgi:hypothetical protein